MQAQAGFNKQAPPCLTSPHAVHFSSPRFSITASLNNTFGGFCVCVFFTAFHLMGCLEHQKPHYSNSLVYKPQVQSIIILRDESICAQAYSSSGFQKTPKDEKEPPTRNFFLHSAEHLKHNGELHRTPWLGICAFKRFLLTSLSSLEQQVARNVTQSPQATY